MIEIDYISKSIKENLNSQIKLFNSMDSSNDIAIVIAAFANMNGGYLLFGVQRTLGQNRIVGLAQDFKINDIIKKIDTLFQMLPRYEYSWLEIEHGLPIFVIKVYRAEVEILINGIKYEMHENQIVRVEKEKMMDYTRVFIVHGRDNEAKQEVARFVEKLDLEAIILHEQVSRSHTIIEKIEEFSNVGFAIVLYTPCDEGRLKGEENLSNRARQNVVFEHGFLMGKIGRKNVCALVKGEVERPNDISGVVYEEMDIRGAWKVAIAKELKAAGYQIDFNKVI